MNQKNIHPSSNFNHNPNDELISNFEKYKLVNNIINRINIDNINFIEAIKKINIREELIYNGVIAPRNSIYCKEEEIKELINSLFKSFDGIKKIERRYVKSNSNKDEYFISNNKVIELIHSNLTLSKISEAWIRLLFISSSDSNIKKSKIIFRKDNIYKSQELKVESQPEAKIFLYDYVKMYKNSLKKCFPLPPESSYKYVDAIVKNKNAEKAFSDKWLGNKTFNLGERSKSEMQICFGYETNPDFFFNTDFFSDLSLKVYKPLIDAIT